MVSFKHLHETLLVISLAIGSSSYKHCRRYDNLLPCLHWLQDSIRF